MSLSPTEATVSILPNPTEAASLARGALPNPVTIDEFKIRREAAERVEGALRRRVLGHRATAAILMLAALLAIGGGIALIFYAGEVAKQQRAADVESLVERANELSRRADAIRKDAEENISNDRREQTEIKYITDGLSEIQKQLSDEKDPEKIRKLQTQVDDYKARLTAAIEVRRLLLRKFKTSKNKEMSTLFLY